MSKDPMEMDVEELDAVYGEPEMLGTVTHILGHIESVNHDRFTVEVFTEDSRRLNIRFTEAALRNLISLIGGSLAIERPKAN